MNKLIQTIALSAVVFSPLTLISLATSAAAHHTSSHVSTVAVTTPNLRKVRIKNSKKAVTNVTHRQKNNSY
jgi:hypothetical protein